MKKIDLAEVKRLSSLSALSFSEEELNSFLPEFENILEMVEQIKSANTDEVELKYSECDLDDLREDKAREGLSVQEVLTNSPKTRKGCFSVPQMLED